MAKNKVGIVGYGFVGKATKDGLKNCDTFLVDPKLSTTINDLVLFNPKIVFICVPTPMSDNGSIDASILESTCQELSKKIPNASPNCKKYCNTKYYCENSIRKF